MKISMKSVHSIELAISIQDPDEGDEDEKCTVIINLMQRGRRAMRDEVRRPMTLKFNEGHEGQVHVEFDLLSKI